MALDEALLESYLGADPPGVPTLCLYSWLPATLSLGRGQDASASHDPAVLREEGIDLVRRATGGLAVLHEDELTYALTASLRAAPFDGGVIRSYELASDALALGLARLGIDVVRAIRRGVSATPIGPACFRSLSIHELSVGGRKLVGSAQLRRRHAFLQHGSIPLRVDAPRYARALGIPGEELGCTDLESCLGRRPNEEELLQALVEGFSSVFNVRLIPAAATPGELLLAHRLRCWKYDSSAWTLDARQGSRERRWGPADGSTARAGQLQS